MSGQGSRPLHNPGFIQRGEPRDREYAEGERLLPSSDLIQSMFAQQTARRGGLAVAIQPLHTSVHTEGDE